MKNLKSLLLTSLLLLTSTLSIAQLKDDFKGTWVGTDAASDNVYELKLNADATCSFKINGTIAFNITNYRIESMPASALDDDIQSPVRNILFQTNLHNTAVSGVDSFSGNGTPQYVIYRGELKFTDESFNHLRVSFKSSDDGEALQYDLTR